MRQVLYTVLILNLLFEGLAAGFLLAIPVISSEFDAAAQSWALNYGFAAAAMASMVFWIWRFGKSADALGLGLGFLALFHVCLATSLSILASFGEGITPAVIHGVFAVACIALFLNREKCVP